MIDHDQADPEAVRGISGLLVGAMLGGLVWVVVYFTATEVASLVS